MCRRAGPALLEPHVSRGAAFGDIDNDGTVEIVVTIRTSAHLCSSNRRRDQITGSF